MYRDVNEKIKNLTVKDKNFFHIFTFKKYGYSLIFLQDFLDTLELLTDFSADIDEVLILRKQFLFIRICSVFNDIMNQIFLPLDLSLIHI